MPASLDLAVLARWLGYGSLFLVVGVLVLRVIMGRMAPEDRDLAARIRERGRRLGLAAAGVLLVACALRLLFQVRAVGEPGAPLDWATLGPIVRSTTWGHVWSWQAAAAIAVMGGFALSRHAAPGWVLAWLGAIVGVVAAPLTGHAAEHPWGPTAGSLIQGTHLLAGAVWLGTLAAILTVAYPAVAGDERRERVLATVVHAYSPLALTGGVVAMAAGVVLAFEYVGSLGALTATGYGRVLLLKVLLLSGVGATGAYNWRRVRPAMGHEPGAARLRKSATAELALGTLLLAATAILVAMPAPGVGM